LYGHAVIKINNNMKLSELFEYQLFKHAEGFKIYINPSASDIRTLLKNSYVLSKLNIDLTTPLDQLQGIDDDEYHGGDIHGLDYPLRGIVAPADGDVYIVDSFDAEHIDLGRALLNQGVDLTYSIHIAIEKQTTAPRGDLEDYMIGSQQAKVNALKGIPAIQRMKMPVGEWN